MRVHCNMTKNLGKPDADNPSGKPINKEQDCNLGKVTIKNETHSISLSRSSSARLQIPAGSQPQNIGLNLRTKVLYRPKTRLNYRDFLLTLLLSFFVIQGAINYFEKEEMRARLDSVERNLEALGGNLGTVNDLVEQVVQKMKTLEEENLALKGLSHTVVKREVQQQQDEDLEMFAGNGTRLARSVGRGPLSVHLKGALPEISVRDGGVIAPWYADKGYSGMFNLADKVAGERKGVIEILEEGLYFIYAQMYYLTSSSLNSYAINVQVGEGRSREESVVAVCSAEAANNKLSELSCYTAVVRYLQRGDRIFVTQRERNRRIIFRDNKSFLGLTLLNSPNNLK